MRVMQVIPTFGMGGAEKVVLNYMRSSKKMGGEMRAVSLYPPMGSNYDETIKEEQLDVKYLCKKRGYDLSIIKKLNKEIYEYKPDVIHTHLHSLKYVLLCQKSKEVKIFHTIHNPPEFDTTRLDRMINGRCFRTGKVIPVTLHERLADEVNSYYKIENTHVIYNAIFLDDYKSSFEKRNIRIRLGLPEDAFIVGNVGSFKKQKNHEFLINLFCELRQRRAASILLLVGDGKLRKELEDYVRAKHIEDCVVFLGNRGDIADLMCAMDVFVLPSRYEGLGIVAIEAQIAGVRCVVSDAVPKNVIVSDRVSRLPLNAPMSEWVRNVLVGGDFENPVCEIKDYDSYQVVGKLLELYESEDCKNVKC